jgi:hypothetical protein
MFAFVSCIRTSATSLARSPQLKLFFVCEDIGDESEWAGVPGRLKSATASESSCSQGVFGTCKPRVEPIFEVCGKIAQILTRVPAQRRLHVDSAQCLNAEIEGSSISPSGVVDYECEPLTRQALWHASRARGSTLDRLLQRRSIQQGCGSLGSYI